MKNIKNIYETFGISKRRLIIRQELLPLLSRFEKVEDLSEKGVTFSLVSIEIKENDPDNVYLNCLERNKEKVTVIAPFSVIPAILLKRIDLEFEITLTSPLCVAQLYTHEKVYISTKTVVSAKHEKRNYRLETNFKDWQVKDNSKRIGKKYHYLNSMLEDDVQDVSGFE